MSLFKGNKRQLKILTLASKTRFENGAYDLSLDVIKHSNYDKITKMREKENQVYEELDCILAPCSGTIEMELNGKKCQFKFTVSGALKPSSEFEKGEDVLEYNDSSPESRRYLHLIHTIDEASEGMAYIKFLVDENVMHTVTICGVPVEKTKTMSPSTSTKHISDGSELDQAQTFMKSVVEEDRTGVDADSVSTHKNVTVRTSGPAMVLTDNRASPVFSKSKEGTTYVPATGSADCDDGDEGAVGGETAYDKIVTSKSLHCLASVLSPQDSQKLLINLEVSSSVFEQKKKDYPGDIVSAVFQCLLHWTGKKMKPDQLNQDASKQLYNDLIAQLENISRIDIKSAIMKALNLSKELTKDDFKRL